MNTELTPMKVAISYLDGLISYEFSIAVLKARFNFTHNEAANYLSAN